MNRTALLLWLLWQVTSVCAEKPDQPVVSFLDAKRNQINEAAKRSRTRLPPEVLRMFDAAAAGDWLTTSNLFARIIAQEKPFQGSGTNRLPPEVWYPVQEAGGLCEMFAISHSKFIRRFGEEIIKVIPDGSIYFGGTDPGRFIITGFSSSVQEGKPFLTLTQNQLADKNYLAYLQQIHGTNLNLPGSEAIMEAIESYRKDFNRRSQHDKDFPQEPRQVMPGENIRTANGRPEVSGDIAVRGPKKFRQAAQRARSDVRLASESRAQRAGETTHGGRSRLRFQTSLRPLSVSS